MSTPEKSPSEQPGIPQTDVTPASEQPQTANLEDLSTDELLQLALGESPPSETVPPAEVETPKPPEAEKPNEEIDEDPTAPQEPASKIPGRVSQRFLPAEQQLENAQALNLVRDGKAVDLLDALQQLRGTSSQNTTGTPAEADPNASQAEPESTGNQPPASSELAKLETRLAELREKREEAEANYEEPREKAKIQSEIEDTIRQISRAEVEAERQQAEAGSYNAEYESAIEELEVQYADLLEGNPKFEELLDAMVTAAQVRKDPIVKDPRFVLKIAEDLKDLLAPKAPGKLPTDPPVPPRRATGAAVAPGHSQALRPTQDQIKAAFDAASPEDLLAALSR